MTGWVKLHRSTLTSDVFLDAHLLKLFVWCLLRANHAEQSVSTTTGRGTTIVGLKPGQFLFGAHKASEQLDMPKTTVQERMRRLEAMGTIKIESGTHYSIVTICQWDTYQNEDAETRQPTGNQAAGNRQPSGTEKNENNVKNNSSSPSLCFGPDDRGLAEFIWGKVHALQPSRKAPDLNRWANDLRLARETDGRTLDDLRDLFDRAHADPFWQNNILSPAKLREKFDDLDLKLRKAPSHGKHASAPGNSAARIRDRDWSDVPIIRTGATAGS